MGNGDVGSGSGSLIDQVDTFLRKQFCGEPVDLKDAPQFKPRAPRAMWRVRSSATNEFLVILPQDFPYSPPRIALPDKSKVLVWPHVEVDGTLCALPIVSTVNAAMPEQVIAETLSAADDLVAECESGSNVEDFRSELLPYVSIATSGLPLDSLCAPEGPSRKISLWCRRTGDKTDTVVADTEYQLKSWLVNAGKLKPGSGLRCQEALLLWLDQAPLPNDYPKTADDIRRIAERAGASEVFYEVMRLIRHREVIVLFAVNSAPGAAIFAARIAKLPSSVTSRVLNKRNVRQNEIDDALSSCERPVKLCPVTRRDPSWVLGRDQNRDTSLLLSKTVALIGCGSLGSSVAQQLSDAGVGQFLLVDGDYLSPTNSARHFLGAEYQGQKKTAALTHALKRRHPHIRSVKSFPRMFRYSDEKLVQEIFQTDLILDCTGIWSCMSSLCDLHIALAQKPTMISAWFEPHAIACHSVLASANPNGLRAGFDADGTQWSSVTSWTDPSRRWLSPDGCAVVFSSYGSSELAFHASSVAEHALSVLRNDDPPTACVSVGTAEKLASTGGVWAKKWLELNEDEKEPGNRRVQVGWPLYQRSEKTVS